MSPLNVVKPPWLPVIIHPQEFKVCWIDYYRFPLPWPEEGCAETALPRIWPVPRLLDAQLVDCPQCHRTGVQPRNYEALARYFPGARLVTDDPRGVTIQLPTFLDPIKYPDGAGGDEAARDYAREALRLLACAEEQMAALAQAEQRDLGAQGAATSVHQGVRKLLDLVDPAELRNKRDAG